MMYNTYLCDKNQQSIVSVFRTDLKKRKLVTLAICRPQGVNCSVLFYIKFKVNLFKKVLTATLTLQHYTCIYVYIN